MEILCTRPGCSQPRNSFSDLDDSTVLKTIQQKYCTTCGMPLILGGRYLTKRLLGQGGFGAAFLACDRYTPTMRLCVVKQFQPSGHLTGPALDIAQGLFEREAVVLEQLGQRHRQIPDLLAFFPLIVPDRAGGQETQFFYLVQELIDGQDLETELATKGQFSEVEVTEVLIEVLKILEYVHENGSIHRDIKPSNIMRDKNGILYLLDFGAVKQVAVGAANNPQGSTGIFTQGFAPPEQMQGQKVYPATDLYALAVTCLNLLTGKSPEQLFDSYNNTWNWKAHAPQVSDRLSAIFDRLLLPTPSDRFTSAQEVLQALQSNLSSPISPTPLTPPTPPTPPPSPPPPPPPPFTPPPPPAGISSCST
ncbi:MAG TPA: serine/threonine protein kinase, partial [Cyanothece sp. UBA12306]|nr:serine/threonine protein kinase [Cyanothece sp. UBA12306]